MNSQTSGQIANSSISSTNDTHSFPNRGIIYSNLSTLRSNGITMSAVRMPVSVAVDPVALITTECITISSAMRKHARWAHSSVSAILGGSSSPMNPSLQNSQPSTPRDDLGTRKGYRSRSSGLADGDDGGLANRWGLRGKKGKSMQDNPLMAGFGRLRRELSGCKGTTCYALCSEKELNMMQIYIRSTRHRYFIHFSRSYKLLQHLPLSPP